MAADKRPVSFKADMETFHEVESYQDRCDHDSRSDATRELVEIGLKEAHYPALYSLKSRAIDGAWFMSLLAVASIIAGVMTDNLSVAHAITIAAVLTSVGAALIAAVEVIRYASETSLGRTLIERWHA